MSFVDNIEKFAGNKKTALIHNGVRLKYVDLYREIQHYEKLLITRRFTNGRVALALPSDTLHVALALAIFRLGLTLIEIPFDCSEGELKHYLKISDPDQIITESSFIKDKGCLNNACFSNFDKHIVIADRPFGENAAGGFKICVHIPERDAAVFFTSGSTSLPKGILKSYERLEKSFKNRIITFGVNEKSLLLCNEELNYTMGLLYLLSGLFAGATVIIINYDKRKPGDFLNILYSYPITHIYSNPSILYEVLSNADASALDAASLEFIGATGDIVTTPLKQLVHSKTGLRLKTIYAQSETGIVYVAEDNGVYDGRESIGNPTSSLIEHKLINEDGSNVRDGQTGELCLKVPFMFNCYLNDEALTNAAFTEDGFFRTGDLVSLDEDGALYFKGRKNFMITLRDGENVSPFEVEDAVLQTGLARQAIIAAYSFDELEGNEIYCYVVLNDGVAEEKFLMEIEGLLLKIISEFKIPKRYIFIDAFKFTKRDKIDRKYYNDPEVLKMFQARKSFE
jgi:long-chain acyl-CoA synthetase